MSTSNGSTSPASANGRTTLAFPGVDDPLALARSALNDELQSRGAYLPGDRYDLALSHLYEAFCRLADRWDPNRGSVSLSTFGYELMRRRYTDFLRKHLGDRRYGKERPPEVSLDESVHIPDRGGWENEVIERISLTG